MKSTLPPRIEIKDLVMTATGTSISYGTERLTVARGDIIAIDTDAPVDGRHLLRILATLERPQGGQYRFNGMPVDLDNYRQCLTIKRRIGYVAADAAMISNRTIRENLLLTRYYYENDMTIDIDETMQALCADAGMSNKLNRRPSELNDGELLKAITIREMGKKPVLIVVDRPENFIEITEMDGIFNHLKNMVQLGTSVVFLSQNRNMTDLANRKLILSDGMIRTTSV